MLVAKRRLGGWRRELLVEGGKVIPTLYAGKRDCEDCE